MKATQLTLEQFITRGDITAKYFEQVMAFGPVILMLIGSPPQMPLLNLFSPLSTGRFHCPKSFEYIRAGTEQDIKKTDGENNRKQDRMGLLFLPIQKNSSIRQYATEHLPVKFW
jgi:hypothetical protein